MHRCGFHFAIEKISIVSILHIKKLDPNSNVRMLGRYTYRIMNNRKSLLLFRKTNMHQNFTDYTISIMYCFLLWQIFPNMAYSKKNILTSYNRKLTGCCVILKTTYKYVLRIPELGVKINALIHEQVPTIYTIQIQIVS